VSGKHARCGGGESIQVYNYWWPSPHTPHHASWRQPAVISLYTPADIWQLSRHRGQSHTPPAWSQHGQTAGRTDGWTDGRTERGSSSKTLPRTHGRHWTTPGPQITHSWYWTTHGPYITHRWYWTTHGSHITHSWYRTTYGPQITHSWYWTIHGPHITQLILNYTWATDNTQLILNYTWVTDNTADIELHLGHR